MQIGTRIDEARDAMAGTCQFGVFHPLAASLLYGRDNGAGALHRDHFIFVAMEDQHRRSHLADAQIRMERILEQPAHGQERLLVSA